MKEAELLDLIVYTARSLGLLAYHTFDSRRSEAGWPDLVIVGQKRVLFRELKSETGRVTPAQQFWLSALAQAGADTGVWRPADWVSGQVLRELRALGRIQSERPRPTQAQIRKRLAARRK